MRPHIARTACRCAVRVSAGAVIIVAVLAVACAMILLIRHYQQVRDEGAVTSPAAPAAAWGDDLQRTGRFTASISYTDLAAPAAELVADLVWDDGWFSEDPTEYNGELARASMLLSALAYSESGYYQQGNEQPPYMEQALSRLGFEDVSTDSYRYRSEVIDEALSLVRQDTDAAAYTIAVKELPASGGGAPRTLVLLSVRGSYGSEWLSNLDVLSAGDDADGDARHPGYVDATAEVCEELGRRIGSIHARGRAAELLLVGHSRGGAIANLVAAQAADALAGDAAGSALQLADGDGVRAYTFATPMTTRDDGACARDARYASIFNVLNPADIMPYLPLASWGYGRYGTDIELPSAGDAGFDAAFDAMAASYERTMGAACPVSRDDEHTVRTVVDEVARRTATIGDVLTPAGAAGIIASLAANIDPLTILNPHYPSIYLAWLDT